MARRAGLDRIEREEDETATGQWGPYTLKSAFQPIFAFHDGKLRIEAFEALVRPFRDDQPESPFVFFSTCNADERQQAEELIRTLHLLNASICLPDEALLFLNINPSVFTEELVCETTLRDMRLVMNGVGIEPARIVCEITENPAGSAQMFYNLVTKLRANGFHIAVDDYGADDSDIQRIQELAPDIVKFDAEWVRRLMETEAGFSVLAGMVRSFEDQNICTVFEGIEEGWQLELAEEAGASMVQGFVLAKPRLASPQMKAAQDVLPVASPALPNEPLFSQSGAISFGRRALK
ncbi:EAL domain-containing protein [Aquamicrobium segne]|uniref:EAL domain-containing protein n=1 Tax=Aquamicrobium segne TaxID=469547 RepID=A0ABW0GX87_9HYPH